MIKLDGIHKTYNSTLILDDINLRVQEGKFVTLLGRNGAGKSTLLRLMAGNELASKGKVYYKDVDLCAFNFPFKNDIAFVHENINIVVPQTFDRYVDELKHSIPNWNQEFFNKMAKDRKISLDRHFQFYSRGQKMQLLLMLALASNPNVLLLDEITSVIDVYGRKYFLDLLQEYSSQGRTVVMTTNTINELEFYTEHLVILDDKKIVLDKDIGDVPVVFKKLRILPYQEHPITKDPLCTWAGVNSDNSANYIIPAKLEKKYDINPEMYDRRKISLEDIFIFYFSCEKEVHENAA